MINYRALDEVMYLHRGFDLHSGRQQKEDRLKTDLWLLLGLV